MSRSAVRTDTRQQLASASAVVVVHSCSRSKPDLTGIQASSSWRHTNCRAVLALPCRRDEGFKFDDTPENGQSAGIEVRLNELVVTNLITTFSIVFGFYVTSVSVLYGTGYTKKLYQKIDPTNSARTELHVFLAYISRACLLSLLSVILLAIISLVALSDSAKALSWQESRPIVIYGISLFHLNSVRGWSAFIIATSTLNFFFLYLLLKVFLKGLLEEAKNT